ncbi:hypothetical protein ACFFWD_07815 [Bradyrhizobium erythrophlei]|uniref:hypothetical protein n=1 Tax=Bradyrhizobium erythrophlei TaxID=1437360 RepID=UPI0035EBA669
MSEQIITISRNEAHALGLKRYFNGKLCSKGHVAERLVSDRKCLECSRARKRDKLADDPEHAEKERKRKREYMHDKRARARVRSLVPKSRSRQLPVS